MKHFTTFKSVRAFQKGRALILAGVSAVLLFPAAAHAQSDMQSRMNRLENEIQTLSRAVFKGETPPPSAGAGISDNMAPSMQANIELRLSQMERELRELTGKLEEQSYQISRLEQRMQARIEELEQRLSMQGPQSGNFGNSVMQGARPEQQRRVMSDGPRPLNPDDRDRQARTSGFDTVIMEDMDDNASEDGAMSVDVQQNQDNISSQTLGTLRRPSDEGQQEGRAASDMNARPVNMPDDPDGFYERAFSYLRDSDYDRAETAFTDFLDKYPEHNLAANAQYWLGETFYVRGNYERAARAFAEAYQKYPDGPKGPDNLLKLGMSLAGMGNNEDACLTLAQLEKEYPSGATPILMRAEKEMAAIGCGN